jgi:hypothetical protein
VWNFCDGSTPEESVEKAEE